jgi:hypothetical protein
MSILFPAKKQETNSGFLLAGNGPVQLFRFHLSSIADFSTFSMTIPCSLVTAVTSSASAPADAYSAIAATSRDCLDSYQA